MQRSRSCTHRLPGSHASPHGPHLPRRETPSRSRKSPCTISLVSTRTHNASKSISQQLRELQASQTSAVFHYLTLALDLSPPGGGAGGVGSEGREFYDNGDAVLVQTKVLSWRATGRVAGAPVAEKIMLLAVYCPRVRRRHLAAPCSPCAPVYTSARTNTRTRAHANTSVSVSVPVPDSKSLTRSLSLSLSLFLSLSARVSRFQRPTAAESDHPSRRLSSAECQERKSRGCGRTRGDRRFRSHRC